MVRGSIWKRPQFSGMAQSIIEFAKFTPHILLNTVLQKLKSRYTSIKGEKHMENV